MTTTTQQVEAKLAERRGKLREDEASAERAEALSSQVDAIILLTNGPHLASSK